MPITSQGQESNPSDRGAHSQRDDKDDANLEDLEGLASTDGEADLAASIIFLFP
jgi:hypothetical protein